MRASWTSQNVLHPIFFCLFRRERRLNRLFFASNYYPKLRWFNRCRLVIPVRRRKRRCTHQVFVREETSISRGISSEETCLASRLGAYQKVPKRVLINDRGGYNARGKQRLWCTYNTDGVRTTILLFFHQKFTGKIRLISRLKREPNNHHLDEIQQTGIFLLPPHSERGMGIGAPCYSMSTL